MIVVKGKEKVYHSGERKALPAKSLTSISISFPKDKCG
jgi:hypothetical protein